LYRCILDGEFLTWDSDLQQFEAFGGVRTVGKSTALTHRLGMHCTVMIMLMVATAMEAPSIDATTGKWLCFMAFDVLWAENNSLLEMPLAMRRRTCRLIQCTSPPHSADVMVSFVSACIQGCSSG